MNEVIASLTEIVDRRTTELIDQERAIAANPVSDIEQAILLAQVAGRLDEIHGMLREFVLLLLGSCETGGEA